jgi:hypothetical protein
MKILILENLAVPDPAIMNLAVGHELTFPSQSCDKAESAETDLTE